MSNYAEFKAAVEAMPGGSNTVRLDDVGLPSIMVKIPAMSCGSLVTGASEHDTHPAFVVGQDEKGYALIGKYLASIVNDRAYSIPGADPAASINADNARKMCRNKGAGWCMTPFALWSAIALWCKKNGTMPHGNNSYGKDVGNTQEKAVPTTYDSGHNNDPARTATGTGPVTWAHDFTPEGICDLNGNVWEWCDGFRLVWGEPQFDLTHTISVDPNNVDWKALDASSGSFVAPECKTGDSGVKANGATVKLNRAGSIYTWDTGIATATQNWENTAFGSLAYASGIGGAAKQALQIWGLGPDGAVADYKGDNFWAQTKYNERFPVRGGYWNNGASAGVFALHLRHARSRVSTDVGFRLALYE